MNDLSVIDRFLDVFSRYIDSGFGLLGGEVGFLTATLVAIDMTLAGLFWAMSNASGGGGDDVIGKLVKKVLYVGAFAFILNNFNGLSGIVFRSFAGLGLVASGSSMTQGELLQPGVVRADPVTQRTGFKMVERRGFGHALPEPGEAGARAFATAFHQPGGQGHGVHGARAGAADGGDLQ